ncbi:MAG: hypothetical protein K8R53_00930, partial [Bacteroidales bacterium]|nr:hypothetical protein [Bacteroidales bacterium]
NLGFAEKSILPIGVHLFNDSVYVTNDTSELYRSLLISINDIPANEIVSEIYKYKSFKRFRYYKAHKRGWLSFFNHPMLCRELFGLKDEVEIEYKPIDSDIILKKQIELLHIGDSSFNHYIDEIRASQDWYSLRFERDMAILRIKSIRDDELNLHIIDNIFKRINKINPKSLIIDISSCYYSYNTFWIAILNYLYEDELWLYEYHGESMNLKNYSKKVLKNKDYIIGKYSDINTEYMYDGNIFLITGMATASSAVWFADILRFNDIVQKIYGEETLSKTTQYDYRTTHYLPYTGIMLKLSVSLYYALDKNLYTHGLIPDLVVKPTNVKEFQENAQNRIVIQKVIDLIVNEK